MFEEAFIINEKNWTVKKPQDSKTAVRILKTIVDETSKLHRNKTRTKNWMRKTLRVKNCCLYNENHLK